MKKLETSTVPANHQGSWQLVEELYQLAGLPLDHSLLTLTGESPLLPTSFHVGTLAHSTVAAAALAASQVAEVRGSTPPDVAVDMHDAEYECTGYFQLDGHAPDAWAPLSGLYRCLDGYVRVHANFDHHRDGALQLLGLNTGPSTSREMVSRALEHVQSVEFETKAAAAGLPVYALRSFDEWDQLPQAAWLATEPLFTMTKIGSAKPSALPNLAGRLPLADIRVLDLTRILAGPTCGRALAHYGADVMLVNSPHLPNIEHIADTSRGKRSVHLDLRHQVDVETLKGLVSQCHVWVQGYRPGGIASLGFDPEALAQLRPGIISVSLSAFGRAGPWANRRGFDSLVQTATGFNYAEGEATGSSEPKALPVQILDFASGFLMAFAASAALIRQQREGGSWHIEVSLAQTGQWLRSLGRLPNNFSLADIDIASRLQTEYSGFGVLGSIPHAARFDGRFLPSARPSMPPGAHKPLW